MLDLDNENELVNDVDYPSDEIASSSDSDESNVIRDDMSDNGEVMRRSLASSAGVLIMGSICWIIDGRRHRLPQ